MHRFENNRILDASIFDALVPAPIAGQAALAQKSAEHDAYSMAGKQVPQWAPRPGCKEGSSPILMSIVFHPGRNGDANINNWGEGHTDDEKQCSCVESCSRDWCCEFG